MTYNNPIVDDQDAGEQKHETKTDGHEGEHHDGVASEGSAHAASESEGSGIERAMDYYLSPDHLIGHVQDAHHFEGFGFTDAGGFEKNKIEIPWISPWTEEEPLIGHNGTFFGTLENDHQFIGPATFQPSKFVILELIGALIVCAVFIPFARRIKGGDKPSGRFSNMLDATLCYVRDEIVVPGVGSQDAKRFLPFVWTIFFFVLALNLIGMVPGLGAATGSISVTAAFALSVFLVVMGTGMKKMGVVGFLKAQAPHLDINPALKLVLLPMIWAIEVFGLMIKHMVLAVRLFANMFAGHLVLGVFVAFIGVTWGAGMLAWGVVPVTILASIAISLLELLVAFIQAYVFAFLTSLFIGTAIHPH
ncbi:MAG: F0F1 ATP synthase subunit A [Mariniblastus sp.]|nr:F0F1 ATP synthase subunit A [Mariniblastus sp.]